MYKRQVDDPFECSEGVYGVILATAHNECIDLDWEMLLEKISGNFIFEGPRALSSKKFRESGWEYSGVGFPA